MAIVDGSGTSEIAALAIRLPDESNTPVDVAVRKK
jgi:hypothetical protein